MASRPSKKEITEAIDAVRICDDRLGAYSDHEGNRDGPVSYFWDQGHLKFSAQCRRAIRDHQAAVKAWRVLKALSARRISL